MFLESKVINVKYICKIIFRVFLLILKIEEKENVIR